MLKHRNKGGKERMRERRSDGLYNAHTHIQYVEGHEICSKNKIVQTKVQ